MASLQVATYNIRYDNLHDGSWNWAGRKGHVLDLIREEHWDIFGVQEVLYHQLKDLESLDEFHHYGTARDDGMTQGEYNVVFYRKNRFGQRDAGTFWLTDTPDLPSKYPGAGCNRICAWVELYDKQTDKNLVCAVTHLDNASEEARDFGANLILTSLKNQFASKPFLLMGDFNSLPDSNVCNDVNSHLDEVKQSVGLVSRGTFSADQDFSATSPEKNQKEIDYIYFNSYLSVENVRILDSSYEGRYPSDHFPVVAEFVY